MWENTIYLTKSFLMVLGLILLKLLTLDSYFNRYINHPKKNIQ